jgi:hypothetical protein
MVSTRSSLLSIESIACFAGVVNWREAAVMCVKWYQVFGVVSKGKHACGDFKKCIRCLFEN